MVLMHKVIGNSVQIGSGLRHCEQHYGLSVVTALGVGRRWT